MFRSGQTRTLKLPHGLKSYRLQRPYSSGGAEPLRILFCGSDEFSIKSLEALHKEHKANNRFIEAIDVVCRPAKRTGRGLKTLTEVPIKQAAQDLQLPLHELDTFKDWQLPATLHGRISLIVAVSFGLFIPKRILSAVRFGGVNVHASLLPDLRGPSPIQYSIVNERLHFGVSVQTLHTEKFDMGTVLAQTALKAPLEPPTVEITSAGSLTQKWVQTLADVGAATLVRTLHEALYLPPHRNTLHYAVHGRELSPLQDPKTWPPEPYLRPSQHAPKIVSEDRRIAWDAWDWRKLQLRHGALGQLWDDTIYQACHPKAVNKRIIFQQLAPMDVGASLLEDSDRTEGSRVARTPGQAGLFVNVADPDQSPRYQPYTAARDPSTTESNAVKSKDDVVVGIATCDEQIPWLQVKQCTVESGALGKGQKELARLLLSKEASKIGRRD